MIEPLFVYLKCRNPQPFNEHSCWLSLLQNDLLADCMQQTYLYIQSYYVEYNDT